MKVQTIRASGEPSVSSSGASADSSPNARWVSQMYAPHVQKTLRVSGRTLRAISSRQPRTRGIAALATTSRS